MINKLFNLGEAEKLGDYDLYFRHSFLLAVILTILAIAYTVYVYKSAINLSKKKRNFLGGCHFIALMLLICLLMEPAIKIEIIRPLKRTLLVLMDNSESMNITDKRLDAEDKLDVAKATQKLPLDTKIDSAQAKAYYNKENTDISRLDLAKAIINHPEINFDKQFGEKFNIRYYVVGDGLSPKISDGVVEKEGYQSTDVLAGEQATGKTSKFGSGMSEAVSRHAGQDIAGLVLLSDFIPVKDDEDSSQVAKILNNSKIPVYTVGLGNTRQKDINVKGIIAPDVVFKGDKVPLRIHFHSNGFDKENVDVKVEVNGVVVHRQTIQLSGGSQFEEIIYSPQKEGGNTKIKVIVENKDNEVTHENNSNTHTVKIIDEKIQVLYIEGMPRWEFRYLRWVLKRDQRLNVNFLMTEGDPFLAKTSKEHLAAFPKTKKEIMKYDLVILGDVRRNFFSNQQLELLEELVKKGGGSLLMVAGRYAAPQSYKDSIIANVLPVEIGSGPWETISSQVSPVLTTAGEESPITSLVSPQSANESVWKRVRNLDYRPSLKGAKPGATVLLTLPDNSIKDYPLVAWQRYGKGKSMFVGTEDLWRMRLEVGDRYHARFWAQSIQFLTLSRLLGDNKQISLETEHKSYSTGQHVRIYANVLDESYNHVDLEAYTVEVQKNDSTDPAAKIVLSPVPGTPGFYSGDFLASEEGAFTVTSLGGDKKVSNMVEINVENIALEKRETAYQEDNARQIAELSNGKNMGIEQLSKLSEEFKDLEPVTMSIVKEKALWDLPIIFILLVLVAGFEWYFRRRENQI